MTPRLQALITAEPGHVLTADDWAGLCIINAEPARGSKLDALVVLPGGDLTLIPWARRERLKVYEWQDSGPIDPRQA